MHQLRRTPRCLLLLLLLLLLCVCVCVSRVYIYMCKVAKASLKYLTVLLLNVVTWSGATCWCEGRFLFVSLGLNDAKKFPSESDDEEQIPMEEENEKTVSDEDKFKSPDQLSEQLITLSMLPESRWRNLTNLDLIKVKRMYWLNVCAFSPSREPRANWTADKE